MSVGDDVTRSSAGRYILAPLRRVIGFTDYGVITVLFNSLCLSAIANDVWAALTALAASSG